MARNKSRPGWLAEYVTRPETERGKQLNKAIYKIGTVGVNNMDRNELKQVGLPIIREARARIRQLEAYGLTDSPAYQYIKGLDIKISTSGTNLNKIRHNVMEAYNFLHSKTSTVEGASEYSRWLDEHLGAETTQEQREKIWDLIHRFEKTHPQHFINFGYDEAIRRIAKAAATNQFDVDEAYADLERKLMSAGDAYESEETLDRERISPWYRGRNSTDEF